MPVKDQIKNFAKKLIEDQPDAATLRDGFRSLAAGAEKDGAGRQARSQIRRATLGK
ncbi:hypothetical protein QA649_26455 [Bradyrhizobium sp. CB1717]|uniref:hypothetical protein n=1 Tax=Bradyrhizobium sp. CB1717 TaxID=3039154 RepID=UPI0024B20963|nr:hypothetical protein [Bradyrhizobium sp. CB1717]WFU21643.1 hypothetical protein QA649_26455 [Bradyrhizobium sp. CB1717]